MSTTTAVGFAIKVDSTEAEALRGVIALQFATETRPILANPNTFEILRAAMNEWAPVFEALDVGFLPVEEFVVDTFRTEYTVGADMGASMSGLSRCSVRCLSAWTRRWRHDRDQPTRA